MHSRPLATIAALVLVGLACQTGCKSSPTHDTARSAAHPLRPARISHVVFFKLRDPDLADDMLADCDALLPAIPGVVSYASGQHVETGRDSVDHNYDGALYVGFMTEADYAVYVDHANHTKLITKWRPQLEWLRVYDVLDETP